VDDEHVLAFIEAVHRADLDAIEVFALDAGFDDDVGHTQAPMARKSLKAATATDQAYCP
jgi:hypothetical protein